MTKCFKRHQSKVSKNKKTEQALNYFNEFGRPFAVLKCRSTILETKYEELETVKCQFPKMISEHVIHKIEAHQGMWSVC